MAICRNCKTNIPQYSYICPNCRLDPVIRGKVPKTRDSGDMIPTDPLQILMLFGIIILWSWLSGATWEDWAEWFNNTWKLITDPAYRDLMAKNR